MSRVKVTCGEILDWLVRPGGNLQQFSEEVSPQQASKVRVSLDRLRGEIQQVQCEIVVDPLVASLCELASQSAYQSGGHIKLPTLRLIF